MAQCSASHRQARTHVAAGHFHNWRTGLQPSIGARGNQDGPCRPVLHAAAWLKELGLGQYAAWTGMHTIKRNKRGATNQVEG